jgi:hypothetical protein
LPSVDNISVVITTHKDTQHARSSNFKILGESSSANLISWGTNFGIVSSLYMRSLWKMIYYCKLSWVPMLASYPCGISLGESITANVAGYRFLASYPYVGARMTRIHIDSNVSCMQRSPSIVLKVRETDQVCIHTRAVVHVHEHRLTSLVTTTCGPCMHATQATQHGRACAINSRLRELPPPRREAELAVS